MAVEVSTGAVGRRARAAHPERIDIGSDVLVRNDKVAEGLGASVRTIDKGDALGAPFIYVAGIKYRPEKEYREFLTGQIQRTPLRRRKLSKQS